MSLIQLGINIDHVATVRQARRVNYPDPIIAAEEAIAGGGDFITLHLREDRRHIQDNDVYRLKKLSNIIMNLEMAATDEMIAFAEKIKPEYCCLVPEKREELTTEGGLDVINNKDYLTHATKRLSRAGIEVSFFIAPDQQQIDAAKRCGAAVVELHTGAYTNLEKIEQKKELKRIETSAHYAHQLGLIVNAGHGLTTTNVQPIAAIPVIRDLNIGHGIVARAIFIGMRHAVAEMKALINQARIKMESK